MEALGQLGLNCCEEVIPGSRQSPWSDSPALLRAAQNGIQGPG